MGSHGFSIGLSAHTGVGASGHVANGVARHGTPFSDRHRRGYGPSFYPYYLPYNYYPYDEAVSYEPPYVQVVEREAEPPVISPTAPAPPAKARVIDIPAAANPLSAKPLPPTIFILASGERVETRRFLLTAINLSLNVDRRPRTIPLDQLDLDATIAANRERGIDLRVPTDQNEILLRF
jgi:hypothetical protein